MAHRRDDTCRVCLRAGGTEDMFDGSGADVQYRYCTLLDAFADDGLPDKLCAECKSSLRVSYDFRMQAIFADSVLRKSSALMNTEADQQSTVGSGSSSRNVLGDTNIAEHLPADQSDYSIPDDKDAIPSRSPTGQQYAVSPVATLQCEFCMKIFSRRSILNIHRRLHTGEKPFQCDVCPSTFTSRTSLNRHRMEKHGYRTGVAALSAVGNVNFHDTTTNSNQNNTMSGHGVHPFECDFCGKTFKRGGILKIHRRLHTGEKPYNCDECEKKFITRDKLNLHKVREHEKTDVESLWGSGKAPFNCDKCEKSFSRFDNLRIHRRTHIAQHPYSCVACGGTFNTAEALNRHKESEHMSSNMYQCEFCQKTFGRQRSLKIHRRLHTGENPYACNMCATNFRTVDALNRHKVRVHIESNQSLDESKLADMKASASPTSAATESTFNRPFPCEFCDKSFTRRAVLERHRRLHTGERPFSCDECNEEFICREALKSHRIREHRGAFDALEASLLEELPLQCEFCHKSFTRRANLKIHRRLHTGERPYSCTMCQCTFKIAESLNRHKVREHMRASGTDNDGVTVSEECRVCASQTENASADAQALDDGSEVDDMDITELPKCIQTLEEVEDDHFKPTNDVDDGGYDQVKPLKHNDQDISCESGEGEEVMNGATSSADTTEGPAATGSSEEWTCEICAKCFRQSAALKRHMSTHSGFRPFSCDYCDKKFTRASVLNIHRRLHTGERPYQCTSCPDAFRTKEALLRHLSKAHP